MYDNKLIQSITALLSSYGVSHIKIEDLAFWKELGQTLGEWSLLIIGIIRFIYWLKDQKKNDKKD